MTRVTTTCPQCSTVFRVNPEQLAARRGQVRCGRCRHVFNGYETVSLGPGAVEQTAPATARPGSGTSARTPSWRERLRARLAPRRAPAAPVRPEGLTKMVELVRSGPAAGSVEAGALRVTQSLGLEQMAPALPDPKQGSAQRGTLLKVAVLVCCLGLPLVVMGVRAYVVQWVPASRSLFALACQPFGCSTPLPADAERWSIESHELRENPDKPALIELSATLRNRAGYVQAYPSLELHLTDVEGSTVQRIVLQPGQFLPADHPAGRGLAANSEVAVHAELKPSVQGTAGYRLVLFFP